MLKYVELLRTLITEIVTTHVKKLSKGFQNSILWRWDDEKAPLALHHENVFVTPKIALAHRRKKLAFVFIHYTLCHITPFFFFLKDL